MVKILDNGVDTLKQRDVSLIDDLRVGGDNLKGTVKWFNSMKSYECFRHQSALSSGTHLNEGDRVRFEIEDSSRGPETKNVRRRENRIELLFEWAQSE